MDVPVLANQQGHVHRPCADTGCTLYCILTSDPAKLSKEEMHLCKKKNRCIRPKISGDQGRPWLSRGWTECEIVTLAGRGVGVKLLYNPGDRKFRSVGEKCWNEDHVPERLAPRPPVEQPRRTGKKRWVGVNMLQFCSVPNSPLTQ